MLELLTISPYVVLVREWTVPGDGFVADGAFASVRGKSRLRRTGWFGNRTGGDLEKVPQKENRPDL